MKRCRIILLKTALLSFAFAQQAAVPDDVAWSILFQILRTAPAPHWDFETKCNWLAPAGLSAADVNVLQNGANRYFQRVAPVETRLKQHHQAFKGQLEDRSAIEGEANLQRERNRLLYLTVDEVRSELPAAARERVSAKIEDIKRNTKHAPQFKPASPPAALHH